MQSSETAPIVAPTPAAPAAPDVQTPRQIAETVIEGHRVGFYRGNHPDYEQLARAYIELEAKCESVRPLVECLIDLNRDDALRDCYSISRDNEIDAELDKAVYAFLDGEGVGLWV